MTYKKALEPSSPSKSKNSLDRPLASEAFLIKSVDLAELDSNLTQKEIQLRIFSLVPHFGI